VKDEGGRERAQQTAFSVKKLGINLIWPSEIEGLSSYGDLALPGYLATWLLVESCAPCRDLWLFSSADSLPFLVGHSLV